MTTPVGFRLPFAAIGVFLILASSTARSQSYDLTSDGIVDSADIGVLMSQWGGTGSADFDTSGVVDDSDLDLLLNQFNPALALPPPTISSGTSPTILNPYPISGVTVPNTDVRIYVDGVYQHTVTADGAGQFSDAVYLDDGVNNIVATAFDGIESGQSIPLSVEYNNTVDRNQGGAITQDTVWTAGLTSDPYIINSNLTIHNGAKLILMPGAHVEFPADYTVVVDGEFEARGTASDPILFTSGRASKAWNNWQGFQVNSSTEKFVLKNTVVEYAHYGVEIQAGTTLVDPGDCTLLCVQDSTLRISYYGVMSRSGSMLVDSSIIESHRYDGIYVENSNPAIAENTIQNNGSSYSGIYIRNASNPVITGNTITGQRYGVSVYPANRSASNNAFPVINGNSIYGHTYYNIRAQNFDNGSSAFIDATGNWLGSMEPSAIAASVYDFVDGVSYGAVVDYSGYLDGAGGSTVAVNTIIRPLTSNTAFISGETYEVQNSLVVPNGVKLTIPENVTLNFNANTTNQSLYVQGELEILGTAANPVILQSGQSSPSWNQWKGIVITDIATEAIIRHAQIRHADMGVEILAGGTLVDQGDCTTLCVQDSLLETSQYGIVSRSSQMLVDGNIVQGQRYDGIWVGTSSPSITGNTIQNNGSSYSGIYVRNAANPEIMGNIITGQRYGVNIYPANRSAVNNAFPTINGNSIYGHSYYNIQARNFDNGSSAVIDATGNWLGSTEPAAIATSIYDYVDGVSYGAVVDYSGYLDAENGNPVAVNTIIGPLTSNTTFVSGETYEVQNSLVVPNGVKLTIQENVTLNFNANTTNQSLYVQGELEILGTAANPVVLKSGQTSPSWNQWKGIVITDTATEAIIQHAQIRHANMGVEILASGTLVDPGDCTILCLQDSLLETNNYGVYSRGSQMLINNNVFQGQRYDGIYAEDSSPSITNNTIQNNGSSYSGIYVENASNPVITGNTITGQRYGVSVYPANRSASNNAFPVINGNNIYGNSYYNIRAQNFDSGSSAFIDATGNWLGSTDSAAIASSVYDFVDGVSYGAVVDYSGYLDGAGGSPVAVNTIIRPFTSNTAFISGETYEVQNSLVVANGVKLTIPENVTLNFNANTTNQSLYVQGELEILGTAANPVILQSGQPSPAANQWQGIQITDTAITAVIKHAEIRHANFGVEVLASGTLVDPGDCTILCLQDSVVEQNRYGVVSRSGQLMVDSNTVQSNTLDGVYVEYSTPYIVGNIIQNNGSSYSGIYVRNQASLTVIGNTITGQRYGVNVSPANRSASNNSFPVINGNSIYGNSYYNLRAYNFDGGAAHTINATGNWLGSADPATLAAQTYDNLNSTSYSPIIDYSGYLDAINGSPVDVNTIFEPLTSNTSLVSGETYEIQNRLVVPSGIKLTIPENVRLNFNGNTINQQLYVDGELEVLGTAANPVVMQSGQSSPATNQWQGIQVTGTATAVVIQHAELRHSNFGVEVLANVTLVDPGDCSILCVQDSLVQGNRYGLVSRSGQMTIDRNTVQSNTLDGIYIENSTPTVTDNTIQNNGSAYSGIYLRNSASPLITGNTITGQRYGVYIYPANRSAANNSFPIINGNSIYGHTYYNVYAYNFDSGPTHAIDATGNWWGTTFISTIEANIYDSADNASYSPDVNVSGYLDDAGGSAVNVEFLLGDLTVDTTLDVDQLYEVAGTVNITSGTTLTIPEGAELRFNGSSLLVYGNLVVQGTANNPARLISAIESSPAANDWGGIVVNNSATQLVIEYAEISHADRGVDVTASSLVDTGSCNALCIRNSSLLNNNTALFINGASPWIERNIIEGNLDDGIYINNASPNVVANRIVKNGSAGADDAGIDIRGASSPFINGGNQIAENNRYGIYLYGNNDGVNDPTPVVTGNGLYDNVTNDVRALNYANASGVSLDFSNNWWRDEDVAGIASNIYDHTDSSSSPIVDAAIFSTDPSGLGLVTIDSFTINQKTIRPTLGDQLDITVDVSATLVDLTLQIFTERNKTLVYESTQTGLAGGQHVLSWDGQYTAGGLVPDEAYVYEIYAEHDVRGDSELSSPVGGTILPSVVNDAEFAPYKNDFYQGSLTFAQDVRVRLSVGYGGGSNNYFMDDLPFEAGVVPVVWDGRDYQGNIVDGTVTFWVNDTPKLATNVVIVKDTKPAVSGIGPYVEVKSNPYRITHSYDQFSEMAFNISADAYVTVSLLPPGESDPASINSIKIIDNQLLSAVDGALVPIDHPFSWTGYDPADTNNISVSDEGAYTFVIEATGAATGYTTTYRGVLQLYH